MLNQFFKRHKIISLIGGLFPVLTVIGVGLYFLGRPATQVNSGDAPEWHGIIPGKTTIEEAVVKIGDPDNINELRGYQIYQYEDRSLLKWRGVELWAKNHNGHLIVVGVFLYMPYGDQNGNLSEKEPFSLEDLIELYDIHEPPNKVTWTYMCWARYLIWSEQGVAGLTGVNPEFTMKDRLIAQILLFEPMTLRQALITDWPWPASPSSCGWAERNICDRDSYPEDPYAWEELLPSRTSPTANYLDE